MDKILNLTLSYPDFQLNQVIDPDQVDLNNSQIVAKVNEMGTKLNTLFTGTTGAKNITIEPITQFSDKGNVQDLLSAIVILLESSGCANFIGASHQNGRMSVQDFLNTLDTQISSNSRTIETILSRTTAVETVSASNTKRVEAIEVKNITQDSEIESAKTRLGNIETVNTTQNADISTLQTRATFHDTQIATINSTTTNHASKINTLENKASSTSAEISAVKSDVARINATNTNQEVIDAKVGFKTLKERINYNEISIGANPNVNSKLSMVVTDSNEAEFWEDKLAVASLQEHNVDPNAHGGSITAHNVSSTAHEDIRRLIAEKASSWEDIQNKPIVFPSTVHTHNKSQISDFAHTHTKSEITDFAHTHTKSQISDFAHNHAKTDVGLGNVDNVKQMPLVGGTFAGDVSMASGTKFSGHVVIPHGKPANATMGSLWLE